MADVHDGQGAMPSDPEMGPISRPSSFNTLSDDAWRELDPRVQRAIVERETRHRNNVAEMGQRFERKFSDLEARVGARGEPEKKKTGTLQDISDEDLDAHFAKVNEMLHRTLTNPEDEEAKEFMAKAGPSAIPTLQKEMFRREAARAAKGIVEQKETEWGAQSKRDATLNAIRAECGSDSLNEGHPIYDRAFTILSEMGNKGSDVNNQDVILLAFRLAKSQVEGDRSRAAAQPRREDLDLAALDDESFQRERSRVASKKGGAKEAFEMDLRRFVSGR